ncbi:MAG: Holliday junction resolvase RuvX [Candidatus Hodgkinia cicadicola]
MKYICLDAGQTFGVAKAHLTAPIPCAWRSITALTDRLNQQTDPTVCVITYPLSVTGKRNTAVRKVQALASALRRKARLPVLLRDERFTSKWGALPSCHSHSATLVLQTLNVCISPLRIASAPGVRINNFPR